MDKILSIDYGDSKVGVAVSSGVLAVPLRVIRYKDLEELSLRIKNIVDEEKPVKIVVGVSSGEMADKSKVFGNKLGSNLGLPVEFVDETLSTKDAQRMSIEAGMSRKKRKNMEDAFAAALILQKYVDSQ